MWRRFGFLFAIRRVNSSIARVYMSFPRGWRVQLGLAVEKYRRAFGGQFVAQLALQQAHLYSGVAVRQAHPGAWRNYDSGAIRQHHEGGLGESFDRVSSDDWP